MAEEPTDADEFDLPAPVRGGSVVLRERFLVNGDKPLPELDSPNAKAYMAEDRHDLSRNLFALVCTPGIPLRTKAIRQFKANPGPGLLELVEFESLFWPAIGQRTMVIIYERPMGGRVIEQVKANHTRITEYDIPRKVIQPIIDGLRHIHSLNLAHRAVRPDNIFFSDEDMQEIILGDCVTAPEGFDQPLMYEPLERALANPAGRGTGSIVDDMYALGASIVVLALGANPIERMKGEDLLFRRTNLGSYAAVCGNARIPLSLLEPLRGLLSDDPHDRWGLDEATNWLNGLKQTPKQKKPAKKGDTPFRFGGRDHTNVRTLAHAFNRQIPEAVRILKDETFHAWMKRSLSEGPLSETLKGFVDTANFHKDDFQGTDEYLIARCCAAMDPYGPIRYKGVSVYLDGFGPMLAMEVIRNGNVQVLTEIINREVYQFWAGDRANFLDSMEVTQMFAQLKAWLANNEPGYGLERCLYELNPGLSCQSPFIIEDGIIEIDQLLPALDRAANHSDSQAKPMDRHVAAFIAARFNEDIHPHLRALAASKESTNIIGMLSLLAFLQWKLKAEPVFGLTSWIGGLLGPAINAYHSRTTRRDLEKEIPKLVRRGSLPDMFDLIDDADKRREDQDGYADAVEEYRSCADEISDIEGSGNELQEKAEKTGQRTAATISIITTMIAVTIMFFSEIL
ncbi:MAG: hypothetical protein JJ900_03710 [Rhodospirillales bacterium]|nr:hypothetical protein [Rhodospirillales bacterium]MBO6785932.1 hypothetical protein [Rhodospirillales bacterium]